jgi:DNA helicase-2/ATP-dependent DNA helicase PcrA
MFSSTLAVHVQRYPDDPARKFTADTARDLGWTLARSDSRLGREDWLGLDALVRFAESAPATLSVARFAAELDDREAWQGDLPMRAVVLGTLHAAKGLEWDAVHLVGLAEGLLPISHARGFDAIDEERRLLYVGITRARKRLSMSWARRGARGERQPSRFLEELRSGTRGATPTPAR